VLTSQAHSAACEKESLHATAARTRSISESAAGFSASASAGVGFAARRRGLLAPVAGSVCRGGLSRLHGELNRRVQEAQAEAWTN
jgi:hypothetical protein